MPTEPAETLRDIADELGDTAIERVAADTLIDLAAEFDRLRGTNVSRRGTAIERLVDASSGRSEADDRAFIEFLADMLQRVRRGGV